MSRELVASGKSPRALSVRQVGLTRPGAASPFLTAASICISSHSDFLSLLIKQNFLISHRNRESFLLSVSINLRYGQFVTILTLTIFLNGKYFAPIKLGKSVGLSKELALAILWFLQVGKLVSV